MNSSWQLGKGRRLPVQECILAILFLNPCSSSQDMNNRREGWLGEEAICMLDFSLTWQAFLLAILRAW